ncbi:MAG: hypothetical protein ACYC6B_09915 [Thermoleophilia bacterium]
MVARAEMLTFLNAQISQLQADLRRPGWTRWALLGGLGTAFWVLLSVIEDSSSVSWINICGLIITGSFLTVIGTGLISMLNRQTRISRNTKFFSTNQLLGENRAPLVLLILWWLSIFILNAIRTDYLLVASTLFGGVCGAILIDLIVIFISSWKKYPFPIGTTLSLPNFCILGLPLLIAIPIFFLSLLSADPPISFSEIRISGLIMSLFFLMLMLSFSNRSTSLLNSFVNIRNDLFFEKISLDTALKNAEIALLGQQFTNTLEWDETLSILRRISEEIFKLEGLLEKQESLCATEGPLTENQIIEEKRIDKETESGWKKLDELLTAFIDQKNPVRWSLRFMNALFSIDQEVLNDARELLTNASDEIHAGFERLKEKSGTISERCKSCRSGKKDQE